MNAKRSTSILLVLTMLFLLGSSSMGCATKRQLTDLEAKVDQALSAAQSAQATVSTVPSLVDKAEAAADRAENAANRAEAMANKAEAVFMQKMKK